MQYTIKQAADLLGVTRPTIRKYFSQLPEDVQQAEGSQVLNSFIISEKALNLIAEKIGKKIEKDDNSKTKPENESKILDKSDKLIEILEKTIETLNNQLSEKDNQIADLNKALDQQQQLQKQIQDKFMLIDQKLPEPPETIDIKRLTNYL